MRGRDSPAGNAFENALLLFALLRFSAGALLSTALCGRFSCSLFCWRTAENLVPATDKFLGSTRVNGIPGHRFSFFDSP